MHFYLQNFCPLSWATVSVPLRCPALPPAAALRSSARSISTSRMSGRWGVGIRNCPAAPTRNHVYGIHFQALNLKLPDGILGILKPTVYHAEARSSYSLRGSLAPVLGRSSSDEGLDVPILGRRPAVICFHWASFVQKGRQQEGHRVGAEGRGFEELNRFPV